MLLFLLGDVFLEFYRFFGDNCMPPFNFYVYVDTGEEKQMLLGASLLTRGVLGSSMLPELTLMLSCLKRCLLSIRFPCSRILLKGSRGVSPFSFEVLSLLVNFLRFWHRSWAFLICYCTFLWLMLLLCLWAGSSYIEEVTVSLLMILLVFKGGGWMRGVEVYLSLIGDLPLFISKST